MGLLPKAHNELSKTNWATIGKQLTAYVIIRSRIYPHPIDDPAYLGVGQSAEDITQKIIEKTLSGERQWDPDKGSLWPWLVQQANSVIDHLYKSASFRQETNLDAFDQDKRVVIETTIPHQHELNVGLVSQTPDPHEFLILKEKDQLARELIGQIFAIVDDDPGLQKLMEAILNTGFTKPASLALATNQSVQTINNQLRKLRRRVAKSNNPTIQRRLDDNPKRTSK
jgi:hypothetical protein